MKKIGFIGAYDKTDIILSIAKVLTMANRKVLILDNTITQKCKYVVPVINPTKSYITTYEDIDVAVGFENLEKLKQYIGLQENENLDYDFFIIDTDNFEGFSTFGLQSADIMYFVTSFDAYSLKKGIEILSQLGIPKRISGIFFSKEMLKEEENYFEYLALGTKVIWDEYQRIILEEWPIIYLVRNKTFFAIRNKWNLSNVYFDSKNGATLSNVFLNK